MNKKQLKAPVLTDLDKSYKRVFGDPEGKLVLEDLKATLKHGQTVYQYKCKDTDLYFELGRQSVINDILYILNK